MARAVALDYLRHLRSEASCRTVCPLYRSLQIAISKTLCFCLCTCILFIYLFIYLFAHKTLHTVHNAMYKESRTTRHR